MKTAPLHPQEKQRLKKLYDYDVLDTEAEQVFDDLTRLASEICGTPISLISLVDPDRQWFKSKVGLDADETDREIAFCSHAILEDKIFEVSDASKDERFHDNPLVTDNPDIRFYAGMPLNTPDGLPIGTLCVIDTKPKTLNKHQRRALEILSREVIGQLELRLKTKRLEKAVQFKTEFLSNMSHEIRTPLNAIIGFCDVLLADADKYLTGPTAKQYLNNIDFSGKHLLSMINDVLDLGKIEAGKMELNPKLVDLKDTMENLVDMLRVKAQQSGIELTFEYDNPYDPRLFLDAGKFSQVVINIVNNAIKFSHLKSEVKVQLQVKEQIFTVKVIDQGIGISKEDLPHVFDKYYQVGRKDALGTGLGLSITMGLVELMGGDLFMDSEEGKGTTVEVQLPRTISQNGESCQSLDSNQSSPDLPLTESELKANTQGLRILVVEDNKINQALINAMLNKFGCDITIVENGTDGVTAGTSNKFDLILMDINLPDISGIDAAKQIKQNATSQGQPEPLIISLSADVFIDDSDKVFSDYLTKPVTLVALMGALNSALKQKKN